MTLVALDTIIVLAHFAYLQMKEDCSKRLERSMRTDEQQCLSMKTVLTVGLT